MQLTTNTRYEGGEKPFYDTNVKIMKNVWYEELCVP